MQELAWWSWRCAGAGVRRAGGFAVAAPARAPDAARRPGPSLRWPMRASRARWPDLPGRPGRRRAGALPAPGAPSATRWPPRWPPPVVRAGTAGRGARAAVTNCVTPPPEPITRARTRQRRRSCCAAVATPTPARAFPARWRMPLLATAGAAAEGESVPGSRCAAGILPLARGEMSTAGSGRVVPAQSLDAAKSPGLRPS